MAQLNYLNHLKKKLEESEISFLDPYIRDFDNRKQWIFKSQNYEVITLFYEIRDQINELESKFVKFIKSQLQLELYVSDLMILNNDHLLQLYSRAKEREELTELKKIEENIITNSTAECRENIDSGATCVSEGQTEPNANYIEGLEEPYAVYSSDCETKLLFYIFTCHILCISIFKVMENATYEESNEVNIQPIILPIKSEHCIKSSCESRKPFLFELFGHQVQSYDYRVNIIIKIIFVTRVCKVIKCTIACGNFSVALTIFQLWRPPDIYFIGSYFISCDDYHALSLIYKNELIL